MTMTQYGCYFTLVIPLDEDLTHRMGEDAVQSAPPQPIRQRAEALEPMTTVTELVADVPVFLCELIGLQLERAVDVITEGIADDDVELCFTRQGSSHPRKQTSSDNLWRQMQGRTVKTVIVQSTTG